MSRVVGIRGATTADENSKESIYSATTDLLKRIVEANDIHVDDVAACFFTTTEDLNADFPALAARREMGWDFVALLCGHEMNVPGGQERCIRVMILVNTDKQPHELKRIYLREAANLRARSGKRG